MCVYVCELDYTVMQLNAKLGIGVPTYIIRGSGNGVVLPGGRTPNLGQNRANGYTRAGKKGSS